MKRKFPTHVSESKNNTRVKKVGHTSEFLFDIYCWTSKKPDYLLKKVLKWVNKKYKNFNVFKKERKRLGDIIILRVWQTGIRNYGSFFILLHPIPKKPPKLLEISSFYICVPETTIIWVWFLSHSMWDRIFCHFGPFFSFYSPNNPQYRNFEKVKKPSGDVVILRMCTKNHDHIIYVPELWSVTDIIFCHFGPFFVLLPH